ncbi:hypothetical protein CRES_1286 [Corynebacterium resistens DSM 45100]|uniref:Protein nucleotidyltransferase YdiU n=1 Tax=Corynebacterium resistens (strain DSM 45100 / JCM 12819 / GTC 2026 / SICGH 158) TaxID=662755 RepID=F8DYD1_CORRG|nr:protein adenylyltransferase SelO family protein [Corynebacterium resistens]AEI09641.1 hypothetical protein CRES_1286 [Corynebacterium resistens DSM 45100]
MASSPDSPGSPSSPSAPGTQSLHASSFATQVPELAQPWRSASFPDATLAITNDDLRNEVPVQDWDLAEGMEGWATAYSGHQFGHFNPVLGDGRALLLGETTNGREVQLKGSGPTPFSRGGDGFGTLGSMLREYIVSEIMHYAGIPTTRIAAVFRTGTEILRNGRPEPGGIAVRVASSHVRVGTFQFSRLLDEHESGKQQKDKGKATDPVLPRLVNYVLRTIVTDSSITDSSSTASSIAELSGPASIITHAVRTQASLVASWMKVGFVHGVMNTDNMSLAGETIDYGPCAFVDNFDPAAKFSSIDTAGRYAFGQQPTIAMWNIARLAEALCGTDLSLGTKTSNTDAPITDVLTVDEAAEILHTFPKLYEEALAREFGGPLPAEGEDLRQWWKEAGSARNDYLELAIPRNFEIEQAIEAAAAGDVSVGAELVASIREKKWQDPGPPAEDAGPYVTYCGT